MTAIAPTRPVLRYHGGKWILAPWIISHFGPHSVYAEWFGGAASVLLRKPRAHTEIYNDRWALVVNLFRTLRDPEKAKALTRALEITPYARDEFEIVTNTDFATIEDPVELARLTIFRSFAGFGSASTNPEYCTGFRGTSKRSGSGPATDFYNYPQHIETFTGRLRGVTIENSHYSKIARDHDADDTLHYLDPPYVRGTRNTNGDAYAFEMTDADHVEMINVARKMKGQVVISGYDNELYRDLLPEWPVFTKDTKADGAVDRVECLWLNPKCAEIYEENQRKTIIPTLF